MRFLLGMGSALAGELGLVVFLVGPLVRRHVLELVGAGPWPASRDRLGLEPSSSVSPLALKLGLAVSVLLLAVGLIVLAREQRDARRSDG